MKKIFTLLTVFTLTTVSTVTVISCTIAQDRRLKPNDAVLLIGKNIDTSKAIDDAESNLEFTNYYILGDSLSDSHGIEKLVKNNFKVDFKLGTDNETEVENYQYGSFSNGKTAGVLLNDKLGFKPIKPGISNDNDSQFGRNYAIGGATAADVAGMGGLLLNQVTIEKQARALVSQHKLRGTDLVFMEIGGNDLFQLVDTSDPQTELALMKQSVERIQEALFTLLNNGIRKIIFSDAPNVSLVPRYVNSDAKLKQRANDLSTEFHFRVKNVIEEANRYYEHAVREWGLYDNLPVLMEEFKAKHAKAELKVNFNTLDMDFMKILETGVLNAKRNPNIPVNADINDYFFFDDVHPTREVHQLAMEHYYATVKGWT
ncbi:SGNH/GDSL hydrolase family protein [Spiroplasma sp. SV19]|uniref:SGNH/GDSL hydrolase family protein n=1 Tax=Spiroplasma sp. SV19 TaxID=2570468 RepID=UPI0024B813E1|nr:SGNH/GDSL hydrolase family protein [Spiroplasma sp. SV19]WHQ36569.1 GDSL family lipase [Spiroplasma sp. SV19]